MNETPASTPRRRGTLADYVRIARPDHWIKNLFILPGFFAADVLVGAGDNGRPWLKLIAAFVSTSLIASANYAINEWLDAKFDRFHPTKKNRPVVVAEVRGSLVVAEWAILAALGLAIAWPLGLTFFITAAWLLVMGIVYNVEPLRTKDIPFLDVLSESVNNMIRLLLGWFTVAAWLLPPCSLVLGYWMAGAFLMAAKRLAEFRMIGDKSLAGRYRKSFSRYSEVSLLVSSVVYAMLSTLLLGVFLVKHRIELLLSMPPLVALFADYLALVYRPDSAAQKPEKLYREKGLMLISAIFVVALVIGCLVRMPWLGVFTTTDLVKLR